MFFILLVIVLTNLIPTLTSLSTEYHVVSKEINNLNFNYFPYFCSKIVVETLFTILVNLIFISITYYLTNYPLELKRFSIYAGVLILFSLIVQAQSLIIASLFVGNFFATIYIGLITVFPLLLYTGYLIKVFHMPECFKVFSHVFPSYYTYNVMLISIFGNKRCSKNLETKRKLNDLKHILRTIVLKTYEEDNEQNDSDDSLNGNLEDGLLNKLDGKRRLKRQIWPMDKSTDGVQFTTDRYVKEAYSEETSDLFEQSKNISTTINYLIKPIKDQLSTSRKSPNHLTTKIQSNSSLHSAFDLSRSTRESTGNYDHFTFISLRQLVSNKNLVRLLRLTSGLNSSDLNGILIYSKDGLEIYNMSNNMMSNLLSNITNNQLSNLKSGQTNILVNNLTISNQNLTKHRLTNGKIDQNSESDLINEIKSTILNLSDSTDSDETKLSSTDIDTNQLDESTHKPTDQTINDSSFTDQMTERNSIDDLSSTNEIIFDSTVRSTSEFIDKNDESTDDKPTDKPTDQTIDLPNMRPTDEPIVDAKQFSTTINSAITSTNEDSDLSTKPLLPTKAPESSKVNIYRLPLNRNLSDDQIPEYNIPSEVLLYLLDNFFKRVGVPVTKNDEELSDDDFDERSRVLIVYDIKSDEITFHFKFLVAFYIFIRTISYFVYRWRIHKFD